MQEISLYNYVKKLSKTRRSAARLSDHPGAVLKDAENYTKSTTNTIKQMYEHFDTSLDNLFNHIEDTLKLARRLDDGPRKEAIVKCLNDLTAKAEEAKEHFEKGRSKYQEFSAEIFLGAAALQQNTMLGVGQIKDLIDFEVMKIGSLLERAQNSEAR